MTETKTLRVLHLFANLNLGGAESRVMDLYRSQVASELVNDFLIMTDEHCHFTDEVVSSGGTIHVITNPRKNILRNLIELYQLLKENPQYDAIHAHTSYYSGIAVFVATLAGIKSRVTHARNKAINTPSRATRILFAVGRFLALKFATTRFAVSSEAGQFLYGEHPESFKVVPNAFNFDNIQHKADERVSQLQVQHQIDNRQLNIVLVARFYSVKNHEFLIKLVAHLLSQKLPVCLHLIGDGELRNDLEALVDSLGIHESVRFWGKRQDVAQLLSLFDLMVMPSFNEGLGVAALEAQAAGLPCILSSSIPNDVDMHLGLCQFLNLDEGVIAWARAVEKARDVSIPSKTLIDQQFRDKGYQLSSTRKKYFEAYQHGKED
ncbi:glycosyltransferase [Thalassotalea ganghwensis]